MIPHPRKPDKRKVVDAYRKTTKTFFSRLVGWFIENSRWEKILIVALVLIIPFLLFYNLGLNPRTWHDEGDALSLSRTLLEDGVYGLRVSDGYQTFGIVQSIGPPVILPVALAFKIFGVSIITGRVVGSVFALITLMLFFWAGKVLIGQRAAIIAIIVLLSSPGVDFLLHARQVTGLAPALGFFLAGVLTWIEASKSKRYPLAILSGLLIGIAIVTKSQYLIIGIGAFAIISIMDLIYYRLGVFKLTIVVILVALGCYGAWNLWQWIYFGQALFLENAEKLAQLSQVSFGLFRPEQVIKGMKWLLRTDKGHYFLFWGFLSLPYIGLSNLKKDIQSLALVFLLIFTCLGLGYVIFWFLPLPMYFFVPLSITALFVGKLYDDLAISVFRISKKLKQEIVNTIKSRAILPANTMSSIGSLVAFLTFTLWMGSNFENTISLHVLDQVGNDDRHWPRDFTLPYETADFLNQTVDQELTIETSERELAVITNHNYHTPDQSILTKVIPYVYVNNYTGVNDYRLGSKYFNEIRPDYIVVGYFAKAHQVYDMDFILDYYEPVKVIGAGGVYLFEYDIYQLKNPF